MDRMSIQALMQAQLNGPEIAGRLGLSRSTINREINRSKVLTTCPLRPIGCGRYGVAVPAARKVCPSEDPRSREGQPSDSPELHEQLGITAQAEGKRSNLLAQEPLFSRAAIRCHEQGHIARGCDLFHLLAALRSAMQAPPARKLGPGSGLPANRLARQLVSRADVPACRWSTARPTAAQRFRARAPGWRSGCISIRSGPGRSRWRTCRRRLSGSRWRPTATRY